MTSQELVMLASQPGIPRQIDRTTAADNAPSPFKQLWDRIEQLAPRVVTHLQAAEREARGDDRTFGHQAQRAGMVVLDYTSVRTWYGRSYFRRSTTHVGLWKLDDEHNGYKLGDDGVIYTARDVLLDPMLRTKDGHPWSCQAWHHARTFATPTTKTLEALIAELERLLWA